MSQPQSLAEELEIPKSVLTKAAQAIYDLLEADQLDEAITMGRGLVAAEEANGYYRSLLATGLFRRREMKSALEVVEEGLKRQPGSEDLTPLRAKIRAALGLR
jgi:predicted Zn-dependent protease